MKNIRTRKCSGCRVCENICPNKCIEIRTVKTKTIKRIEESKCSNCGLCQKVCPHNNAIVHRPLEGYIGASYSHKLCKKSSSGGIVAALYTYYLRNGWRCVGVRYTSDMDLVYDFIDDEKSINEYQGSRYLYSDMRDIYDAVSSILAEGKKVLFVGLPCHVAALRNRIGDNGKELYCVDLVCSGMPMKWFFEEYLNNIRRRKRVKVSSVSFREKSNSYGISVYDEDKVCVYSERNRDSSYMKSFGAGLTYFEVCYNCSFARRERAGDMTVKDCCAPASHKLTHKVFYNASQILINTEKGRKLIQYPLMTEGVLWCEDYPVKYIVEEDIRLRKPSGNLGMRNIISHLSEWFGVMIGLTVGKELALLKER